MVRLAPGVRFYMRWFPTFSSTWYVELYFHELASGKLYIFFFTFIIYTCFHLSRKPISVVKSVLHANCSEEAEKHGRHVLPNDTSCDWKPFDGENYDSLFGTLDLVFLIFYAVSLFVSGHIADKVDLRIYLCFGTVLSGLSTIAFGLGYFFDIHSFTYYIIVQMISGCAQATGWPAVIACMGNWFGKSKRGFFMGVWTSHTSLGNILGSLVAGIFVQSAWGWSFIVPGLLIGVLFIPIYLFLVPYPESVGVTPPLQHNPEEYESMNTCQRPVDLTCSAEDLHQTLTSSESEYLTSSNEGIKSTSFLTALRVPGVIEYSLALFFSKFVSYTFLFWLPMYIRDAGGFDPSSSADLSAVFDLGGIIGGILAGLISDHTNSSACTCVVMIALSIPTVYIYSVVGFRSLAHCIGLLIPLGLLINGPYSLVSTAVSADLGTHPSLSSNTRALATVSGIIDGTGSIGAALGPLLCGLLRPHGWTVVIIMLMCSLLVAGIMLIRLVVTELRLCCRSFAQTQPNTTIA